MTVDVRTPADQGEEWYRKVRQAIKELYAQIAATQVGIDVYRNGSLVDLAIQRLDFSTDFTVTEGSEGIISVAVANPFTGLTVQSGDVTTDATVTTLDFDATDFALTESPEDEINIGLNYGYTSGNPLAGDQWERTRSAFNDTLQSTTNISTYVTTNMPSLSITMPAAGTIEAMFWSRIGNDLDPGTVDVRLRVDGTDVIVSKSGPAVGGWPLYAQQSKAVSSGSRTISTAFKGAAASESSISDKLLLVVAYI